jgi:hypothetical protein
MSNQEVAKVTRFEMIASDRTTKHKLWFMALREYLTRHPDHTLDGYMRDRYPDANGEIDRLMAEIGYRVFLEENPDLAAQRVMYQGQMCVTPEIMRAHIRWCRQHGLANLARTNTILSCEDDEEMFDTAVFYTELVNLE